MNDQEAGLYAKFKVERLNPEAQERHAGCEHFVLDITHDPGARFALRAYAVWALRHGNERLALDLSTALARQGDSPLSLFGDAGLVNAVPE